MIKKGIFLGVSLPFLLVLQAFAAEKSSYPLFKHHMHRLFDNYNRAQINLSLKEYDVAGTYLRNLLDGIEDVQKVFPEKGEVKIDSEKFRQAIKELKHSVSQLKDLVDKEKTEEARNLSEETFNICVGCHHEESKLKYLFSLPTRSTPLFGEYMHKVKEHMDLARIYMGEKNLKDKLDKNLKLMNYYIDRLEETFPDAAPSGAIADKEEFRGRLKEAKKVNEDMLNNAIEKKQANLDIFEKYLNGFCVACHAPGRMR